MEDKEKPMTKKECILEAEVLVDLDHSLTFFDIFQAFTGMNEILESILTEMNRCAAQKSCNFETTEAEMQINFIMGINKLRSMEDYWSTGKCIGNKKIENIMTKNKLSVHLTESSLFQ